MTNEAIDKIFAMKGEFNLITVAPDGKLYRHTYLISCSVELYLVRLAKFEQTALALINVLPITKAFYVKKLHDVYDIKDGFEGKK